MATQPVTRENEYEPEDAVEDAHEHGVVFHQVEDRIPLTAEDADDDENR